jgi:penicillin amidase
LERINGLLGSFLGTTLKTWNRNRLPQDSGRIYVDGLESRVSIDRDKWGIPQIAASCRADLFFAQGFVHAQDRLWQLEINRRVAKGELSELLGPLALDTDRLTRTLGFRELAKQTWENTSDKVRDDVVAYTAGVNAYLANEHPLPIEFQLLRHKPEPWEPLDSASFGRLMMWTLSHGWAGELTRARVLDKVGPELAAELEPIYPSNNPVTLPHGIDFNRLEVDGMMTAAAGPYLSRGLEGSGRGSNGWVISATKSASGHAILCNDVHLPMSTPSLWYFTRLQQVDTGQNSSSLDIAGASLPGLPYILIGHNPSVAWGATLSYIDCEDLFIERFHPEYPTQYLVDDDWIEAAVREEVVKIKGEADHIEQVITTRHGPVISSFIDEVEVGLALQSTALMPEAGFEGIARLGEARCWDDFVAAVRRVESPSLNFIYADIEDNTGYFVSGKIPVRSKGQGLVPTDGRLTDNDWRGYIPFEEMPHSLNPKDGYLVTANNRITDDRYPHYLGSLWMNGYRARRITEMITERKLISVEDCKQIQMDLESLPGKELIKLLSEIEATSNDAQLALTLLRQWDGRLDAASTGGAIYQVFISLLTQEILEPLLGRNLTKEFLGEGPHPVLVPVTEFHGQWIPTLLRTIDNPGSRLWQASGGHQAAIEMCLAEAVATLRRVFGPDVADWSWGQLHQISFDHLFSQQPPLEKTFGVGPVPIGGDGNTVLQTAIPPNDSFASPAVAPAYRQIVDMGMLDKSIAMYAPGQSGWLGSPHYADLLHPWLKGEYFSMTRASDEPGTLPERNLLLLPAIVARD